VGQSSILYVNNFESYIVCNGSEEAGGSNRVDRESPTVEELVAASRSSALKSVKKSKASPTSSSKAKTTTVQPLTPAKKSAVNPGSDPSNKKRVQVSSPDRESLSSDSAKQAASSSPLPSKKLNYAAAVKGLLSGLSVSLGEDTMDRIIHSGIPIKEILAAKEKASQPDSSDSEVEEVFDETTARPVKKKVSPKPHDPFDSSPSGDEDFG
jgi:hypothetical protein